METKTKTERVNLYALIKKRSDLELIRACKRGKGEPEARSSTLPSLFESCKSGAKRFWNSILGRNALPWAFSHAAFERVFIYQIETSVLLREAGHTGAILYYVARPAAIANESPRSE